MKPKRWEEEFDEFFPSHTSILQGDRKEEFDLTVDVDKVKSFIASEIEKAYKQGFDDGDTRKQLRGKL